MFMDWAKPQSNRLYPPRARRKTCLHHAVAASSLANFLLDRYGVA